MTRKPFAYVTQAGKIIRPALLDDHALYAQEQKELSQQLKEVQELFDTDGLARPPYNPLALARHLSLNVYHKRSVYTKAQDTAGLGWEIRKEGEKGRPPSDLQKRRLTEFFDSLQPPLSETLVEFMIDRESIGYGALELATRDRDPEGEPLALYHIPAHTIRIHHDELRFQQRTNTQKKTWFRRAGIDRHVDIRTGEMMQDLPVERRSNAILWNRMYSPTNDFYGEPDHIPALGAITGDISRRDYNIKFFDNFGVPAYAVFITGDFDVDVDEGEESTNLEQSIEQHFENIRNNPHSTLVLSIPSATSEGEVQVKFERLSVETKEASFRLYRQDNRDEVLASHAVPPYRAGIAEVGSLGGSTARESTEIYESSVIRPRQEILENMINTHVIKNGFGVEGLAFRLKHLDFTDQFKEEEHEMDLMVKMAEMGAIDPRKVYEYWAEKFDFDKNAPIPADAQPAETQVEAAMQNLQNRLIKIAVQNDRSDLMEVAQILGKNGHDTLS